MRLLEQVPLAPTPAAPWSQPAATPVKPAMPPQRAVKEYTPARRPLAQTPIVKPRKSGGRWIFILIAIGIIRACSSEEHRYIRPAPTLTPPTFQTPDWHPRPYAPVYPDVPRREP
jgi:hypothetical protein